MELYMWKPSSIEREISEAQQKTYDDPENKTHNIK